jgi:hypothetical protein
MTAIRTYTFTADCGWAEADKTWPIYDEHFIRVGAFIITEGGLAKGFLSGTGYPLALKVSTGEKFYATPLLGKWGGVEKLIVSECKLNYESLEVTAEESK